MVKKYHYIMAIAILISIIIVISGCKNKSTGNLNNVNINDSVQAIIKRIRPVQIPEKLINIIEYSKHMPDVEGNFDFHDDIQRAVNELSSNGGGKILFPHTLGTNEWVKMTEIYKITGPIELCSNIEFLIQPSVKLFFTFNPEAYSNKHKGVLSRYEGTTIYTYSPNFRAFNSHNIKFSSTDGNGSMPEITADGEQWVKWAMLGDKKLEKKGIKPRTELIRDFNNSDLPIMLRIVANPDSDYLRPDMFQFLLCQNILIEGIKLNNGGFWMVHPVLSENITFRNLFFDAGNVNNDGIDVESSKDVLIENIIFNNHDDNIVMKAGRNKEGREGALVAGTELEKVNSHYLKNGRITGCTENVVARNCVFKGHHAICAGSEMSGGVRNIYVIDNIAPQNVKNGIYIKSSRIRGGTIENIFVKNLALNIVEDYVISLNPNYDGDTISPYVPVFKNIYIENVTATHAHNGIRIFGWKDSPTSNVWLKNVTIQLVPGVPLERQFEINQIDSILLENVKINGKSFDGMYHVSDPNKKILKQM